SARKLPVSGVRLKQVLEKAAIEAISLANTRTARAKVGENVERTVMKHDRRPIAVDTRHLHSPPSGVENRDPPQLHVHHRDPPVAGNIKTERACHFAWAFSVSSDSAYRLRGGVIHKDLPVPSVKNVVPAVWSKNCHSRVVE